MGFEDIPKILQDEKYYYFTYKSNIKDITSTLKISYDNLNFKNVPNSTFFTQDGKDYIRFEKEIIKNISYLKVGTTKTNSDGFFEEYNDVINFKINGSKSLM